MLQEPHFVWALRYISYTAEVKRSFLPEWKKYIMQRGRHHFDLLTNPIEILSDDKGWVTGMKCIRMELGEPDESGRRRPVEVPGSEFVMELDTVIMSLGTSPNPLISSTTKGLDTNKWKCIIADENNGKTTKEGVYAGGDAVTGAATVILAMGAGKAAAKGIDEYLSAK